MHPLLCTLVLRTEHTHGGKHGRRDRCPVFLPCNVHALSDGPWLAHEREHSAQAQGSSMAGLTRQALDSTHAPSLFPHTHTQPPVIASIHKGHTPLAGCLLPASLPTNVLFRASITAAAATQQHAISPLPIPYHTAQRYCQAILAWVCVALRLLTRPLYGPVCLPFRPLDRCRITTSSINLSLHHDICLYRNSKCFIEDCRVRHSTIRPTTVSFQA